MGRARRRAPALRLAAWLAAWLAASWRAADAGWAFDAERPAFDLHTAPPAADPVWRRAAGRLQTCTAAQAGGRRPFPVVVTSAAGGRDRDGGGGSRWTWAGRSLLSQGKVGVVLLAGGLGTRVGANSPKGQLNLNLPSKRSLFQLHADMLRAQAVAAGAPSTPKLFVMTSPMLYHAVANAFELNRNFGLDVRFFNQSVLPCFRPDGALARAAADPDAPAMSPGGHGDLFHALQHAGALDEMQADGVELVYSFNIDNPLGAVPDPTFLGFCHDPVGVRRGGGGGAAANADDRLELCFKVVDHASDTEPLNAIVRQPAPRRSPPEKGAAPTPPQLAEYWSYHDIRPGTDRTDYLGDIMHMVSRLSFARRVANAPAAPPLHRVPARIKTRDADGKVETPAEPNGYKYERFLSEVVFSTTGPVGLFHVDRRDHFSPIKNGWGSPVNSPATARRDVLRAHRQLLLAAGAADRDLDGRDVELCPALVLSESKLRKVLEQGLLTSPDPSSGSSSSAPSVYLCEAADAPSAPTAPASAASPLEVIIKKRDGLALSRAEIFAFVHGFTREEIPKYQMAALLMAIQLNGASEAETNHLTSAMMSSGDVADLSAIPGTKVDKHSTGGVGDGVSLMLAPVTAACGIVTPMMSGRGLAHTGGTLDKLESIPGLGTAISFAAFHEQLATAGLAIVGPTSAIAPADKKMYALRDVTGTVPSLPLIVASIMSKKLASGADALVLDVKYGSGAFMVKRDDALALARAMIAAGACVLFVSLRLLFLLFLFLWCPGTQHSHRTLTEPLLLFLAPAAQATPRESARWHCSRGWTNRWAGGLATGLRWSRSLRC